MGLRPSGLHCSELDYMLKRILDEEMIEQGLKEDNLDQVVTEVFIIINYALEVEPSIVHVYSKLNLTKWQNVWDISRLVILIVYTLFE